MKIDNYYQRNAQDFFQQTINVDMSPLRLRFLAHLPKNGKILDAGCGSGRDAKAFLDSGYLVKAFDSAPDLAKLAENHLGQSVGVLQFEDMDYVKEFDAIWACASLLHVSQNDLFNVFRRMLRALKFGGVLYVSFKYGSGEYEDKGRRFTNMNESSFELLLEQVKGLTKLDLWVSEDCRPERINEKWFNALLRRAEE